MVQAARFSRCLVALVQSIILSLERCAFAQLQVNHDIKNMISLTRDRTMKRGAVASRRVRGVLAAKSLPALGLALASAGLWVAAPSLAQGIDLSPSAWVVDESPLTDEELAAVLPTGMTLEEFKRGMEAWAPGSVASLQPSAPKNGAAGAVGGEHGHSSDSPKVNVPSSEPSVGDASVGGGGLQFST